MFRLTGHSEDCVWDLGFEEDTVVVIHGRKTARIAGMISGTAPTIDEAAWRGHCHPHSVKVLLKVGFKLFDEFPVIEGDPEM